MRLSVCYPDAFLSDTLPTIGGRCASRRLFLNVSARDQCLVIIAHLFLASLTNRRGVQSEEKQLLCDPLRMPTVVIVCTCCPVGDRAGGWSSRPGRVLAHLLLTM